MAYDVAEKYNVMKSLLDLSVTAEYHIAGHRLPIEKELLKVGQMCQDNHNSKQTWRDERYSQRFRDVCEVSEKELALPNVLPEVYKRAKDILVNALEFGVNLMLCDTIEDVKARTNKRDPVFKIEKKLHKLLDSMDDDDKIDLYSQAIASIKAAKQTLLPKIPELKVKNYVR